MGANLYVGNLDFSSTEEALRSLFESGNFDVDEVTIIQDRAAGRSAGFGFVTLTPTTKPGEVTRALNGQTLDGRPLRVEHRSAGRDEKPRRGSGGPRGRGKR